MQILEQQQGLAILNDHEQLARELHDSVGQMLRYVVFPEGIMNFLMEYLFAQSGAFALG